MKPMHTTTTCNLLWLLILLRCSKPDFVTDRRTDRRTSKTDKTPGARLHIIIQVNILHIVFQIMCKMLTSTCIIMYNSAPGVLSVLLVRLSVHPSVCHKVWFWAPKTKIKHCVHNLKYWWIFLWSFLAPVHMQVVISATQYCMLCRWGSFYNHIGP